MYSSKEIRSFTAVELGKKIADKEITSVEATKAYLEQIKNTEKDVNAYITVMEEQALERAEFIDKKIADGESWSKLMGVPMAIKDVLCMKETLTSCGSKILGNFYPTYTSTAVQNLLDAGVVVLGKTNMDEFAMGSTTESSYFGATKNPWDLNRVPGGSSGGSAAAVAANSCAAALGTDTGGSIRQPASFCGITGIKPTYGRVSRYGQIAYGSSLDQIGPMAKDVADCAAILEIISGHDSKDSTSANRNDTDFTSALQNDVKDPGYYTSSPKYFLQALLDESIEKYGIAEKFIQYTVMYDMRWRIAKQLDSFLSKEDLDRYRELINRILVNISDRIICMQKNMGIGQKIYTMNIKYKRNICSEFEYDHGKLLFNNICVINLFDQKNLLTADFLYIKDGMLRIEGRDNILLDDSDLDVVPSDRVHFLSQSSGIVKLLNLTRFLDEPH